MKREGRQHGVVTSYPILPPSLSRQRFIKMVDSAASTMGVFAKVPTKPTNRSKFTGKCRKARCNGCHLHPVCKSKGKAKGSMKVRSMDSENELAKYSFGTSATGVLAYLADGGRYDNNSDNDNDSNHDFSYDYEDRVEENYSSSYGYDYDYDDSYNDYSPDCNVVSNEDNSTQDVVNMRVGFGIGIVVTSVVDVDTDNDDIGKTDDDDDDDETMSFCDVGLCWGHDDEGEEDDEGGWYLVGF